MVRRALPNVTLLAVACTKVDETIYALKHSMAGLDFHEVLLLTHEPRNLDDLGIKVINIEQLDYKGYNHFVLYKLKDYVSTDFCLLVQNDGYVLRPNKWDDIFFNYDYIGAPWPKDTHFTADGTNVRVGNGGFSFRSKALLNAPTDLQLPFTDNGTGFYHEDGVICVYYKKQLEDYGLKFPPVEVAAKFSHETDCPETVVKSFGFHRYKKVRSRFSYFKRDLKRLLSLTWLLQNYTTAKV